MEYKVVEHPDHDDLFCVLLREDGSVKFTGLIQEVKIWLELHEIGYFDEDNII